MQIKTTFLLFVLCFALTVFPKDTVVKAQPNTIVVPTDYSTIALAISAASNEDTILVKSGTYDGNIKETLVIDKTLSIIGENAKNTIINLYSEYDLTWVTMDPYYRYSDSLIIEANGVEIKNFTINIISSLGLELTENGDSTQDIVESIFHFGGNIVILGSENKLINCDINQNGEQPIQSKLFVSGDNNQIVGCNVNVVGGLTVEGSEVSVEGNKIITAVTLDNSSKNLFVGNIVLDAIYLEYANSNVIANNTCLALIIGPYGRTCSDNLAFNNLINGTNSSFFVGGVDLDASVNSLFYDNEISGFEYGISFTSKSKNNTFYRNNIRNNDQNIKLNTPEGNFWDNGAEGNYWSDYNGTDNDGDGIGDTPYIINENNEDNFPLISPLEIVTIPEFSSLVVLPLLSLISFLVFFKKFFKVSS